ncbi:hypothetical protein QBC45DRAFT_318966, partial [Copromyces sp. CBS 386.78]
AYVIVFAMPTNPKKGQYAITDIVQRRSAFPNRRASVPWRWLFNTHECQVSTQEASVSCDTGPREPLLLSNRGLLASIVFSCRALFSLLQDTIYLSIKTHSQASKGSSLMFKLGKGPPGTSNLGFQRQTQVEAV